MAAASPPRTWISAWLMPGIVLVGGVALSGALAAMLYRNVQAMASERVTHWADVFEQSLEHRLNGYSEMLKSLQARVVAKPSLSRQEFEALATELDAARRYPGVRALTFTRMLGATEYSHYASEHGTRLDAAPAQRASENFRIHYAPGRSEYAVIDYAWSLRGNATLVGLDVFLQPESLSSLLQTRASGNLSISAPFALMQEHEDPTGVVIQAPVNVLSAEAKAPVFVGAVNVSLQTRELVESIVAAMQLEGVAVAIEDRGSLTQQPVGDHLRRMVYASDAWDGAQDSTLRVERDFHVLDRVWRLQFAPRSTLLSGVEAWHPWLMGAGGMAASVLLALLVALLVRQRHQARQEVADTQSALQESNDRFHALFHHCGMGVTTVSLETGRYLQVNQRYCDIVGYTEAELLSRSIQDLSAPEDVEESQRLLTQLRTGRISNYFHSKRLYRKDGRMIWVEVGASPLLGSNNQLQGRCISVVQDVSERRTLQEELEQRDARQQAMLHALPVGMLIVDGQQRILSANMRFTALTGYSAQDLHTLDDWWRAIQPDEAQRISIRAWVESARREAFIHGVMPVCELAVHCKDGNIRALELSGSPVQGDFIFTLVDLSQRKLAEEKIRNLALFDMLTQLPNRRQLLDQLESALQQSRSQNTGGALLLLDIDNFKTLNETLGLAQGDALLLQVAQRLTQCLAKVPELAHTLARQGGDEFAVVLEGLPADGLLAAQQAERVGRHMMAALEEPFVLERVSNHVTVSMGVATFQGVDGAVEELLQRADLALYEAKGIGRNALHFFDPSMQAALRARAEMEADLRLAFEQQQFDLYYQPQVAGSTVVGGGSRPWCAGAIPARDSFRPRCLCRWPRKTAWC